MEKLAKVERILEETRSNITHTRGEIKNNKLDISESQQITGEDRQKLEAFDKIWKILMEE